MHVCHFCDSSLATEYFRNIALGLSGRGVRVSLVDLADGEKPEWLANVPGVSFYSLKSGRKPAYPLAAAKLGRFLKDERVDILQTHLYYPGMIGIFARRRSPRTVLAITRHHTSVVRMLGTRLHIAADKWMARHADHLITVSKAARDYMHDVDGIDRKIEVVYTGFDFRRLEPNAESRRQVRREFRIGDDEFVIGYVGNFVAGKGHVQLIEAFAEIAEIVPKSRLLLPGRGDADAAREAARHLKDKVIFTGWRDDIPSCLNAMDLFVQPSLSEAFSQVLVEAMAAGLPVIATDVGSAREVIEDRVTGILIEPNDTDAICREAVRLFNEAEVRLDMARKGVYSVRERFTTERMIDRYMELYEAWTKKP
jgi:glycosyltransferase involved in cell wall biosynthesis